MFDWKHNHAAFAIIATTAGFVGYFSMYGVRKGWSAGNYEGQGALGLDLKVGLGIAQTAGYAFGKIVAVRVLPSVQPQYRLMALLATYVFSTTMLFAMDFTPPLVQMLALFLNGIPLAWVWGLMYVYLEGRDLSDILGAGMSVSYIIASGAVKSVGAYLLNAGLSPGWMALATAGIFFVPFIMSCLTINSLPPPSLEEEERKCHRRPMTPQEQKAFLKKFAPGLLALGIVYSLLTAIRDYRDLFAPEIFRDLNGGHSVDPSTYTVVEVPVGFVVCAPLGLLYFIRDNVKAVHILHCCMLIGVLTSAAFTALHDLGLVSAMVWVCGSGAGLYGAYVPFACVLFDRLIAALRIEGTSVFMIYLIDGSGYLGSFGVLLYYNFTSGTSHYGPADILRLLIYGSTVVSGTALLFSYGYFHTHLVQVHRQESELSTPRSSLSRRASRLSFTRRHSQSVESFMEMAETAVSETVTGGGGRPGRSRSNTLTTAMQRRPSVRLSAEFQFEALNTDYDEITEDDMAALGVPAGDALWALEEQPVMQGKWNPGMVLEPIAIDPTGHSSSLRDVSAAKLLLGDMARSDDAPPSPSGRKKMLRSSSDADKAAASSPRGSKKPSRRNFIDPEEDAPN